MTVQRCRKLIGKKKLGFKKVKDCVLISVVIPVKNGEPWIENCLKAIEAQTLHHQTETIIIDSGSTDKTLEILKDYDVRVISISPEDFNHGLTRNLGVTYSKGEYVVMTVQDARATNDKWLENLLDGFKLSDNVAGVCGSQIVPHDKDKNPADWFRPMSKPAPVVHSFDAVSFQNLSPEEKKAACGWDDVTAMYKKSVLEKIPFRKTSFAEDALWAKDAYAAGYTLVYNPVASVYHYHHENPDYTYKRTFTVLYHMYRYFGYKPVESYNTFISKLRLIKLLWKESSLSIRDKWKWYNYNNRARASIASAIKDFLNTLNKGEQVLDATHEALCGIPPVAPSAQG
ncbi:hypothetical protein CAP35_02585 [Chitinophagaceae bacterium IBVUCB1]|nr:hypothetical protein CAP35_02585 [Chitinophagaceae bacterium IBVUCB1]